MTIQTWLDLVRSLSSEEAQALRNYLVTERTRLTEQFIEKADISEFDRGVLAGKLEMMKFLIGSIDVKTQEKNTRKQIMIKKAEAQEKSDFRASEIEILKKISEGLEPA